MTPRDREEPEIVPVPATGAFAAQPRVPEPTGLASILVDGHDDDHPEIAEPAPWLRRFVVSTEGVAIAGILAVFLIQVVQIAGRASGIPIPPWTYELARLVLLWMVCLGAFVSYYNGTSLSVPGRWRPRTIGNEAAALLVSGVLFVAGLKFLGIQGWEVAASSLLSIPAAVGYLAILAFAGGVALVAAARIIGLVVRKVQS